MGKDMHYVVKGQETIHTCMVIAYLMQKYNMTSVWMPTVVRYCQKLAEVMKFDRYKLNLCTDIESLRMCILNPKTSSWNLLRIGDNDRVELKCEEFRETFLAENVMPKAVKGRLVMLRKDIVTYDDCYNILTAGKMNLELKRVYRAKNGILFYLNSRGNLHALVVYKRDDGFAAVYDIRLNKKGKLSTIFKKLWFDDVNEYKEWEDKLEIKNLG